MPCRGPIPLDFILRLCQISPRSLLSTSHRILEVES
jgi:hypothetical protein